MQSVEKIGDYDGKMFACSICQLVLCISQLCEDAASSLFCKKCVDNWLSVQKACDLGPKCIENKPKVLGENRAISDSNRKQEQKKCKTKICQEKEIPIGLDDLKDHNCIISLLKYTHEVNTQHETRIKTIKNEHEKHCNELKTEIETLKRQLSDLLNQKSVGAMRAVSNSLASKDDSIHRKIPYGSDLEPAKNYSSRFTLNPNGFVLVACNSSKSKSKMLLYDLTGVLCKKVSLVRQLSAIGISADTIYTVPCFAHGTNRIEIQAFDFALNKIKTIVEINAHKIQHIYPIDAYHDRIYFKVKAKPAKANHYAYMVYTYDTNLNKMGALSFDDPNWLWNLKVRNNLLAYYTILLGNRYEFHTRSMDTNEPLHRFDLAFDCTIDFGISRDSNLLILEKHRLELKKYTTHGKLLQSSAFCVDYLNYNACELRITESADLVINDTHRRIIYLN